MNTMYYGRTQVGLMDETGTVYDTQAIQHHVIGHVDQDGVIYAEEDRIVGSVDGAGIVRDSQRDVIGSITSDGIAVVNGRRIGSVRGDALLRAGAALLLLLEPPVVVERPTPPSKPWGTFEWICFLVALMLGFMAIMAALIFAVATSIVWGVMLLLTCITAMLLSGAFVRSQPDDMIAKVKMTEEPTKRGVRQCVDTASLDQVTAFYPYQLLVLAPALIYGVVFVTVLQRMTTASDPNANFILLAVAWLGGVIVSVILGRRILRSQANAALLRRVTEPAQGSPTTFQRWAQAGGILTGIMSVCYLVCGLLIMPTITMQPRRSNSSPMTNSPGVTDTQSSPQSQPPSDTTTSSLPNVSSPDASSSDRVSTTFVETLGEMEWDRDTHIDQGYELERFADWSRKVSHHPESGGRTRVQYDISPSVFIGIDRSDNLAPYRTLQEWNAHAPDRSILTDEIQNFTHRYGTGFHSLAITAGQLGGEPSVEWRFTLELPGQSRERRTAIRALHNGRLYGILFSAPDVEYASHESEFGRVLRTFRFTAQEQATAPPKHSTPSTAHLGSKCWVVAIHTRSTRQEAEQFAREFASEGLPTGVLWIPDFASMSGVHRWLAYVGPVPYENRPLAHQYLLRVQRRVPEAYALKADGRGQREEFRR